MDTATIIPAAEETSGEGPVLMERIEKTESQAIQLRVELMEDDDAFLRM